MVEGIYTPLSVEAVGCYNLLASSMWALAHVLMQAHLADEMRLVQEQKDGKSFSAKDQAILEQRSAQFKIQVTAVSCLRVNVVFVCF